MDFRHADNPEPFTEERERRRTHILATGGPYDRVEYEVQRTSSLGAPNWMRSSIQASESEALFVVEALRRQRATLQHPPEYRIIRRTITEEVIPND